MNSSEEHIILELVRDLERGDVLPARLEVLADGCTDAVLAGKLRTAAGQIASGETVSDALRGQAALPEPFLAALDARNPDALAGLVEAGRERQEFERAVSAAALQTVALFVSVLLAIAVGVHFGLATVEDKMELLHYPASDLWLTSVTALKWVAGPLGLGAVLLGCWAARRSPGALLGFRRKALLAPYRAAVCKALGALLGAGVSLEKALPLAARVGADPLLRRELQVAADRISGGGSVGPALTSTDLGGELASFWEAAEDEGPTFLSVTSALGDAFHIEAALLRTTVTQRGRSAYAVAAGGLVAWTTITLATGVWGLTTWLMSA